MSDLRGQRRGGRLDRFTGPRECGTHAQNLHQVTALRYVDQAVRFRQPERRVTEEYLLGARGR